MDRITIALSLLTAIALIVQTYRLRRVTSLASAAVMWLNRDGSLADGPVSRRAMRNLRRHVSPDLTD